MNQKETNLGFLLSKATRLIKWEFDKSLKEYTLTTPQWSVLMNLAIEKRQGASSNFSAAVLAEQLYMDRPTMSGIIDRLQKKGLLSTKGNPEDRRSQVISLTKKAMEILPDLQGLSNSIIDKATTGFEDEELKFLKLYLSKLINNLSYETKEDK